MSAPSQNASRKTIASLVEGRWFTIFITTLILINAVTLGMETDEELVASYGGLLHLADRVILAIFTIELALKFYAYRVSFFRSGWNWFDLAIVTIAWLPTSGALTVLRALRILRVLRLISVVPQMRRVVAAIGHSIPAWSQLWAYWGLSSTSLLCWRPSYLAPTPHQRCKNGSAPSAPLPTPYSKS